MKRIVSFIFLAAIFLTYGCNIVPKSVQYQKEEEGLIGSTDIVNPRVEEIQVFLNSIGYDAGTPDGRMAQKTREAIKDFQSQRGLKVTGYINKVTLRQIEDERRANEERRLKEGYAIKVRSPFARVEELSEKRGEINTRDIQTALKNAGFDPGSIDGKMGPRTRQAVKEFQRTKGLKVDGVVGPKTWKELKRYLEK